MRQLSAVASVQAAGNSSTMVWRSAAVGDGTQDDFNQGEWHDRNVIAWENSPHFHTDNALLPRSG